MSKAKPSKTEKMRARIMELVTPEGINIHELKKKLGSPISNAGILYHLHKMGDAVRYESKKQSWVAGPAAVKGGVLVPLADIKEPARTQVATRRATPDPRSSHAFVADVDLSEARGSIVVNGIRFRLSRP